MVPAEGGERAAMGRRPPSKKRSPFCGPAVKKVNKKLADRAKEKFAREHDVSVTTCFEYRGKGASRVMKV